MRGRQERIREFEAWLADFCANPKGEKATVMRYAALTGLAPKTVGDYLETLRAQGKVKTSFGLLSFVPDAAMPDPNDLTAHEQAILQAKIDEPLLEEEE